MKAASSDSSDLLETGGLILPLTVLHVSGNFQPLPSKETPVWQHMLSGMATNKEMWAQNQNQSKLSPDVITRYFLKPKYFIWFSVKVMELVFQ